MIAHKNGADDAQATATRRLLSPPTRSSLRVFATSCTALMMASCSVPERKEPSVVLRTEVPLAGLPSTNAAWPDAVWWHRFADPQLDTLLDRALINSPALDIAQTRYRSAQIEVDAARADARPQLTGLASASRARLDDSTSNSTQGGAAGAQGLTLPSYVSSGIAVADFSYELDWWGKHRAAIEGAIDKSHAALAEKSAAAWLIQYAVCSVYFDWLVTQQRLLQAHAAVDTNAALLDIAKARVRRGVDSPQTLESAQQQLASARQNIEQLRGAARIDQAELAALLGISLADLPPMSVRDLPRADTQLPENARVTLLARRPDVVASRWMIESSARDIDQARAAFFPDISVNALAGFLRSLPTPGDPSSLKFGSFGVSATLPLFDGGRLRARYDQAQAALDAAIAQYNATVVAAAQDVSRQALTLSSLGLQRYEEHVQQKAAENAYVQASARVQRGVDDPRQAFNSQLQLITQRDATIQLEGRILSSNISLIRALGGGYSDAIPLGAAAGQLSHPEITP
jgi:multidrug efflux system outer membrane protein